MILAVAQSQSLDLSPQILDSEGTCTVVRSKSLPAPQRVCMILGHHLCIRESEDYVISNRFVGGQSKPAPTLALVGNSEVRIFIPRGPETCSPKKGHLVNMNKMKDQRWSQYCQHSFTRSDSI